MAAGATTRAVLAALLKACGQADVEDATDHDAEALVRNPAWVQLNDRRRADNPSTPKWNDSDPICRAKASDQDGDGLPAHAMLQGGRELRRMAV